MAKKTLTQATYGVENVQGLADQVKNQASVVKQTFDKTGLDAKTYTNNTLISELQSETNNDSGAHAIGLGLTDFTANNMADGLQEVKDALDGVVLGQIPDGSLTDEKLSNTAGQTKDKINSLQNTTSYGTTVSGTDALTITTVNGGFTFAVGKSVRGIAVNNNTTSMTANVDSDGTLPIKQLDGSSYVDTEANAFEDNKPFELICQTDGVIGDFFLLAPKGGSNIKSIQRGVSSITSGTSVDISISSVKTENSVLYIEIDGYSQADANVRDATIEFLNSTTLRITRRSSSGTTNFVWKVLEFVKLKSKQDGISSIDGDVSISSINFEKTMVFISTNNSQASATVYPEATSAILKNSNTITIDRTNTSTSVRWQVIEFI